MGDLPLAAPIRPALEARGLSFADGAGHYAFTAANTPEDLEKLHAIYDGMRGTPQAKAAPENAEKLIEEYRKTYDPYFVDFGHAHVELEMLRSEIEKMRLMLDRYHTALEDGDVLNYPEFIVSYGNLFNEYEEFRQRWLARETALAKAEHAAYKAQFLGLPTV
jgi:hypothetical protein